MVEAKRLLFLPGVAGLVDVLLPPACVGCREALSSGSSGPPVCARCRSRLKAPSHPRCPRCDFPRGTGRPVDSPCPECRDWPPELSAARCAVTLEPPADALVHGLKYEGWSRLAPYMAARLAALELPVISGRNAARPPLVVPVPTTSARRRARGYNQAELLGRALADARHLPFWTGVDRKEGGRTQVSLHPSERRANVSRAFAVREAVDLLARDVLLVDDVLTTGATAGAVAETLSEAGAGRVTLLAFGRALPRST